TYDDADSIELKLTKLAKQIYGAKSISFSPEAKKKLAFIEQTAMRYYPVCVAKTQYSFSADPKAYGVASDFNLMINDLVINNGAEFIVALAGNIIRMPGLPKVPQATKIDLVKGQIEGLS